MAQRPNYNRIRFLTQKRAFLGIRSKSEARSRFRSFLGASEAIRYLPLGLMSDNGSGDSWGPVGPPGIALFSLPLSAHGDCRRCLTSRRQRRRISQTLFDIISPLDYDNKAFSAARPMAIDPTQMDRRSSVFLLCGTRNICRQ